MFQLSDAQCTIGRLRKELSAGRVDLIVNTAKICNGGKVKSEDETAFDEEDRTRSKLDWRQIDKYTPPPVKQLHSEGANEMNA